MRLSAPARPSFIRGQALPGAEGAILKFISAPRSGLPPCGGRWHSEAVTDEGYCNMLEAWSLNGVALRGLPPKRSVGEGGTAKL